MYIYIKTQSYVTANAVSVPHTPSGEKKLQ